MLTKTARAAVVTDLESLLERYRASEVSGLASSPDDIWASILSNDATSVLVSEVDDRVVATCMLIVAPNLLRAGRQHAFLENVVTHPEYRGQGYGRAVVAAALAEAWSRDCHHVLLQSGRQDPRVHRFYENCGMEAGLRVGYVARRP